MTSRTSHRRWLRLTAVVAAMTLVAAACGDDDDGGGGGGGGGGDGELSSVPGFDGTTIKLGVLSPTTGPVAVIGGPLTKGNEVFFQALNAEGGIAGQYPVELVIEDTQYSEQLATQKYPALRDDVVMFAQVLGTPIVNALLPDLQEDNLVAQPASLDSFWVREQNLLPQGAPYQIQAINTMDWWVNQEGNADSVICWAGHDDPYGDAGLAGMEFAAEQMDFEIAAEVRFSATDSTPEVQGPRAAELQSAGCEFVFLTATPSTAGGLLGAAAQIQFAPQWVGQSPTWVNALAASPLAPYLASSYKVVAEGGLWGDDSIEGMARMLEDIAEYAPDQQPDIYFVFGYAAAWAVSQVLEAAVENGDLSKEGIIEAMNSLEEIDTGGLLGTYEWGGPEDRRPPRANRIFNIDPEAADTGYFSPATDMFASEAAEAFTFE